MTDLTDDIEGRAPPIGQEFIDELAPHPGIVELNNRLRNAGSVMMVAASLDGNNADQTADILHTGAKEEIAIVSKNAEVVAKEILLDYRLTDMEKFNGLHWLWHLRHGAPENGDTFAFDPAELIVATRRIQEALTQGQPYMFLETTPPSYSSPKTSVTLSRLGVPADAQILVPEFFDTHVENITSEGGKGIPNSTLYLTDTVFGDDHGFNILQFDSFYKKEMRSYEHGDNGMVDVLRFFRGTRDGRTWTPSSQTQGANRYTHKTSFELFLGENAITEQLTRLITSGHVNPAIKAIISFTTKYDIALNIDKITPENR